VVEERDAAGELQNRYFHGLEMGPIRQDYKHVQGVGGYLTRFALPDGLDSTRQLSDVDGIVTDSYFYDAFGGALSGDSGNSPNSYRYNGQQLDGASGMYYLRARYYNQGLGRFISHDPLLGEASDPVSLHRYLYASADGVNYIDPNGLESMLSVVSSLGIQNQIRSLKTTADQTALEMVAGQFGFNFSTLSITDSILNSFGVDSHLVEWEASIYFAAGLAVSAAGSQFESLMAGNTNPQPYFSNGLIGSGFPFKIVVDQNSSFLVPALKALYGDHVIAIQTQTSIDDRTILNIVRARNCVLITNNDVDFRDYKRVIAVSNGNTKPTATIAQEAIEALEQVKVNPNIFDNIIEKSATHRHISPFGHLNAKTLDKGWYKAMGLKPKTPSIISRLKK
jgi:RHS repeat-associated protein